MSIDVVVQYGEDASPQPEHPSLEHFAAWGQAIAGAAAEVCVRIVGGAEAARLNRRYRGKAGATNVLSFPFDAPLRDAGTPYLGDVVMAAELIGKEAAEQNKTLHQHWAHLFIHGVLHLRGYTHDDARRAAAMEANESAIMRRLGFPDPWGATGQ